jgi:hypothetical protein
MHGDNNPFVEVDNDAVRLLNSSRQVLGERHYLGDP